MPHYECSMYFQTMRCADFIVKEPMVIGHECAGIIEEVGSEVKKLVPGDRVALEPGISCWRCNLCKEGRNNLCPEMKFFATPPVHGSLANQVKICCISKQCIGLLFLTCSCPSTTQITFYAYYYYHLWSFVKAHWLVQF